MLLDPLFPIELTNNQVKKAFPQFYDLYSALPRTLSKKKILAVVDDNKDIRSNREYVYKGLNYKIPSEVFKPSETSEIIFDKLYDGTIQVTGTKYLVMGIGAGVEAVIGSQKGANTIYVFDIHRESIEATRHNFRNLAVANASQLYAIVSDLFSNLPPGLQVDVITFNPPGVAIPICDDPEIIRVTSIGTPIVTKFFYELCSKKILSEKGEVFVVLSNASELRKIISFALLIGLAPSVLDVIIDDPPYQYLKSILFKFTLVQYISP